MGTSWIYVSIHEHGHAPLPLAGFLVFLFVLGISLPWMAFGWVQRWLNGERKPAPMGAFLFMGLIGIILASIVNIFVGSSALHMTVSVLGVLIFAGLTAYDTQDIKRIYYAGDTSEVAEKKAIYGALRLYLDFINLFLMLLQFMGDRE